MVDAMKEGHGYLSEGECLGVSYVVQGCVDRKKVC